MKDFDDLIRESELIGPLKNASFTWSNLQENPICKRLDRFLFSSEWKQGLPQKHPKSTPQIDIKLLSNCFIHQSF